MAGTTPHVERDTLTVGSPSAVQTIEVGTPAWFHWLDTAAAFTFAGPCGTFTARRERASSGRGGWYWRAYQGMAARAAALGDLGESAPEHWEQPLGSPDVHVVLAALAPDAERFEAILARARR